VDQRAFVLAAHHTGQCAGLEDREDLQGQLLVTAQREGGGVHHLQVAHDGLVEGDLAVAGRGRILDRVGSVDTIDLGGLEDQLGVDLGTPQRGGRVSGEEGVAGAGREDDDLALFQVAQRLGPDVGLDDLLDVERRLHASLDAGLAQGILQGQRVHDRGEHAHVVGRGAVHAGCARRHPTKDVAAADDDSQLDAEPIDLGDLLTHLLDGLAVDAVAVATHQGLAG
jgi:hypothetical protein